MPEESRRPLQREFTGRGDQASFADAYAYLLIGGGRSCPSMHGWQSLCRWTGSAQTSSSRGCAPYGEDTWRRIRIGSVLFHVVNPCARCVVTTVDWESGLDAGKELLATLGRIRRSGNGVIFGQNCVAGEDGKTRAGDRVEILESGPAPVLQSELR